MLPLPCVHRLEQSHKALHNTDDTLPNAPLPRWFGCHAVCPLQSQVLLLLHVGEALHLSNALERLPYGSPLSLVQTKAGEMDYQN